ncbi:hypothetical protein FI667_g356, partial [Globisporangium splendens]
MRARSRIPALPVDSSRKLHILPAIRAHRVCPHASQNAQDPLLKTPRTAQDPKMLDHLLPRIYNDCDFFDESNKENIGYFVRRPTAFLRAEYDGFVRRPTASLRGDSGDGYLYTQRTPHHHRSSSSSRRTPSPVGLGGIAKKNRKSASSITPQDTKKILKKATKTQESVKKTKKHSSKKVETSKKVSSQSIGIRRRPLQDITHLYVNERPSVTSSRSARLAAATVSTSVSMRFF